MHQKSPKKNATMLNAMTCILAIVLMFLAAYLRITPPAPQFFNDDSSFGMTGGCAWRSNPFLSQNSKVQLSAITYCEGGDEATERISMILPAGSLRFNDLMSTGYIDGKHVSLQVQPLARDQKPISLLSSNSESWRKLPVPSDWTDKALVVTLEDSGSAHRQWAGIGLGSKLASRKLPSWLFTLGILLLALCLSGTPVKEAPLAHGKKTLSVGVMLLLITTAVLMFRRPEQFSTPYIWVEDGVFSINQFLEHGWVSLFDPVQGYLILPSKIIHVIAMSLSAPDYPELANWMNVLFTAGVLCAIAFSPTTLRYPVLCALLTLFTPNEGEVFGTSHYAFW